MNRSSFLLLSLLATVVTVLNAFKPLTVDDSVYYYYAAHIAEHPQDPYGFKLAGQQPANDVLAPPALLYWWGAGIRLFGERPFLWKLWLWPILLLLSLALYALFSRFAAGLQLPLTSLTLLSPTVLPTVNLMLDVPALALSLAALVLFFRSCDRQSVILALAAGVVGGLAMQTKYTAMLFPLTVLAYGMSRRQGGRGVVSAAVAVLLFGAWECFIARTYGESHFLNATRSRGATLGDKVRLVQPLIGILGSTSAALLVVLLAGLGWPARRVLSLAGLTTVAVAAVAVVPDDGPVRLPLNAVVFGGLGLGVVVAVAAALRRLWQLEPGHPCPDRRRPWERVEVFLCAWLVLEVLGYFALSPYPAVRRVISLVVVATVVAGRQLSRAAADGNRPMVLRAAVGLSLALGLVGYGVDFATYDAEKEIVHVALGQIGAREGVWFVGHHGAFEFYAEHAGLRRRNASTPRPRPGDWLVVIKKRGLYLTLFHPIDRCEAVARVQVDGPMPLRSRYQLGGVAWERHRGAMAEAILYRVR